LSEKKKLMTRERSDAKSNTQTGVENWELGREAMEFKQPKKGLSFKGKKSATSEWRRRVRKRRHSGNRTLQSTKGGGCHLYIKEDDGRRREATDGRTGEVVASISKMQIHGKTEARRR